MLRPLSFVFGLLLMFANGVAHAQVCSGNFMLSTQAEVDAFNCSEISGRLTVGSLSGPTDITDLTPLVGLTSVSGFLRIWDNPLLTSLAGLEDLTFIGGRYLSLQDNASLTSLSGLSGLTSLGEDLQIVDNASLVSLAGLEGLTSISGQLRITGNGSLESLEGLVNVTSVDAGFTLTGSSALSSLAGLESLASVSSVFNVFSNDALESFTGLESLTTVDGILSILDNASLESLAGLEQVTEVNGTVTIQDNGSLISLSGFDGLTSVLGQLRVYDNASLLSLSGLESLISVGGYANISRNASLTSLAGLESLVAVDDDLYISDNTVLASLSGIESLVAVGDDLTIYNNAALSDCSCGLADLISGEPPAFTGVSGSISIFDNALGGDCTAPEMVLAASCAVPLPSFALFAINTSPLGTPVRVAQGESIVFDYSVTNTTDSPVSGDLWYTAQRNGTTVAQGIVQSGTVPSDEVVAGSYTQDVASQALPGIYVYTLNIGHFPDIVVDSVPLVVRVTESVGRVTQAGWAVSGATPWSSTSDVVPFSSEALPSTFALDVAYPNPFASSTTVSFTLPEAADVRVSAYDVLGREVAVLVDEPLEAGRHMVAFEAAGLSSGVYLVRMTAGAFAEVQRVTLAH